MTEEEFYNLKPGDLVEYNGDKFEFITGKYIGCDGYEAIFKPIYGNNFMTVFKCRKKWINTHTDCDDRTLDNLKLIKKNSTLDEKISETKSEIEKLQNQLKELESEKNSKKIEQLISEMVPGKFYTIISKNYFKTGIYKGKNKIQISLSPIHCSYDSIILIKSIKDIIPREDLTNDYNKFMEKIKKYNQGEI